MKQLLLFILIFISWDSYSQDEKFIIKICPLSLIDDITFPTIQGGLEIKFSERLTWYNELGVKYRNGYFESSDTSYLRSYGFKFKTEIRYYLPKFFKIDKITQPMNGFYVSTNLFYIRDFHNSEIGYYHSNESSIIFTDNFGVKKNLFGLNIVYGLQKSISTHLLIDIYAGVGIRFRIVDNINRDYNSSKDSIDQTVGMTVSGIRDNFDVSDEFGTIANVTFGLRLCYKL